MFGYIKPTIPELRVKEYELYRAVYCGLCESLGRRVNCTSRLSLSYDFVFLALVRMALVGESGKIERHRCLAHPTKKRAVVVNSKELDYAARLSAVLTYHKIRDDIADNKGIRRMGTGLLMPSARRMRKHARFDRDAEAFIAERLSELSRLEKDGCSSLDMAAEPFGELMACVSSWGFEENSAEARIAAEIGRHIGRYIYIIDAIDDLAKDIKSDSYNPFRMMYEDALSELIANEENIRTALTMELVGVSGAVELIDFSKTPEYGEIIKNIIYLGLPACTEKVLSKCKKESSKENGDGNI